MVGYVGSLYGSAWSYAPTQMQGDSNPSQEVALQIFQEDITMLNVGDHRQFETISFKYQMLPII